MHLRLTYVGAASATDSTSFLSLLFHMEMAGSKANYVVADAAGLFLVVLNFLLVFMVLLPFGVAL